jgi:hypothetical protein
MIQLLELLNFLSGVVHPLMGGNHFFLVILFLELLNLFMVLFVVPFIMVIIFFLVIQFFELLSPLLGLVRPFLGGNCLFPIDPSP